MANPHRGQVSFKAGYDTYTLSLSANAACELEAELGMDFEAIVREIESGKNVKLSMLRIVFWKMLEDHHDGITLDETKRILKGLTPVEMGTLLGRAIIASMPEAEAGTGAGASPMEPGGQSGTGPASSVSGAASVTTPKHSGARRRANSQSSSTANGIG